VLTHLVQRLGDVGSEDGSVRNLGAVHQAVEGFEVGGGVEFMGEGAGRMFGELIGRSDETGGGALVAQRRRAAMPLTETGGIHTAHSVANRRRGDTFRLGLA